MSDSVPENGAAPKSPSLVFISYRVDPDEVIATGLKALLEGSIEPSPTVFVSGAGGLRPSALTYRTQLQEAVNRAVAFVGLISAASTNRAWLHFEAGAAWGRVKLYAPVLIDISPSELDSTIIEYQATRATDFEAMRRLADDIAGLLGGRLNRRKFAPRLATLTKIIENYKKGTTEEEKETSGISELEHANELMREDRHSEAEELYAKLLSAASNEQRSAILVNRIAFDWKKGRDDDRLLRLEQLAPEDRKSTAWMLWHAVFEHRPKTTIAELLSLVNTAADAVETTLARRELAQKYLLFGRDDDALNVVLSALSAGSRTGRRDIAEAYHELWPEALIEKQLVVAFLGYVEMSSSKLRARLVDLTLRVGWKELALHLAKAHEDICENGSSANALGVVYSALNLHSLAYESYETATTRGVSVAKANMARVIAQHPVPLAGLKLLRAHEGEYDAAVPGYPFEVRSQLEEQVANEREAADAHRRSGKRALHAIVYLIDAGIDADDEPVPTGNYVGWRVPRTLAAIDLNRFSLKAAAAPPKPESGAVHTLLTAPISTAAPSYDDLVLRRVFPGWSVFSVLQNDIPVGLAALVEHGTIAGLVFTSTSPAMEQFKLELDVTN